MRVQRNSRVVPYEVTANARGLTGRAGLALVAETAKAIGASRALSRAARGARSWSLHDPGKVLRDVALTLADGGDALRHMKVIDGQPELFGPIASTATTCRTIIAVAQDPAAMEGLAGARAAAREQAWRMGGAPPAVKVAWGQASAVVAGEGADEPLTVDLDATLIVAHSDDKDGAGKTYKRTWGHHPLNAYLDRGDGHGESLAGMLRPGNAGANNAKDHIAVFDAARAQLPELPEQLPRLVRADTAGATHDFLDHVTALEQTTGKRWQFSVGFPITEPVRNAIRALRCGKDTGMRTLPCDTFDRNALWLQLVLLAQDLMTFTQLLTLEEGELRSAEPQQLQAAAHPRPHHPPRPRGAARHPTQLPVAPMISPWQVGWVFTATPSTDVIRPPGDSVGIGPRAQGAPLASARGHDPS